ncbi:hypothetical protein [Hyalangium rubrum]|uniref:Lipoprotein n=1 Tax=Hyalangium rubrum TaxID=3103134 RepID=A0ABU5HE65_9BACT|nr:hypothetical protein [Hyalangium sp. s54d21]MDY7231770.1 hypothetical protein [Hyalangium sp. s54d21]
MPKRRSYLLALASSMILAACGPAASRQYAQMQDSATSACLRNPACYTASPGEEAILPWLSRSIDAARTTAAVLKLLDAAEIARVEQVLHDCALEANAQVNDALLGKGNRPTQKLCQETFTTDARGNKVTWAMHLGQEKHKVALECAQKQLGELFAEQFSLQPQYRYNRETGVLELLDPKQVAAWLRDGLWDKLLGTLIPDVVLHASGNPLNVQEVYDFKFPCTPGKTPSWTKYPRDHPHHPRDQGDIYNEALKPQRVPARVAPGHGAFR